MVKEKELVVINEQEVLGKPFRIYGDFEKPLFMAKDVAERIKHSQADVMIRTVDDGEKLTLTMFSSGQNREMWFLTEDGLYEVLMQSRKPIAKQFKAKVKEILKDIRQNGLYVKAEILENMLSDPGTMINVLTKYRDEKELRLKAEKQIEEQQPMVTFAETCLKSKDNILIRQLAKIACDEGINIGEKRLYQKLREWGFIVPLPNTEPYQKGINQGFFKVKERDIDTPFGVKLERTTLVTPKGQLYIINRLKKEFPILKISNYKQ